MTWALGGGGEGFKIEAKGHASAKHKADGTAGAHRALRARCAKSRLFSTTGSHGPQGPEFCTPDAVLNGSCTRL